MSLRLNNNEIKVQEGNQWSPFRYTIRKKKIKMLSDELFTQHATHHAKSLMAIM